VKKNLQDPISVIKGIGNETENVLNEMGIFNVSDLLNYFPYRYEDYEARNLEEVKHDENVTVEGKVHSGPSLTYYGKKRSRLTFRLLTGNFLITVICFNRPYLKKKLVLNSTVSVSGKWDKNRQAVTMNNLKFGTYDSDGTIEPVYSVKEKVTVKMMRRFIQEALAQYADRMQDPLPSRLLLQYKLPDYKDALAIMHMPRDRESLKHARRRFIYEEFLFFQLKMQAFRKFQRERTKGIRHPLAISNLAPFINSLSFSLTDAQRKSLNEIIGDMTSPHTMNRLLQGDVGSGKTAVAAIALYGAVVSGFQGAMMVPTEILAEQHADSLHTMFLPHNVNIALLTSSVKGKARRELLERLRRGEIDILVGTHALIQEDVEFKQLSLVITDEQHRFGVEQRKKLKSKGKDPDVLFMTATPIPRTLAITVYGEMDVSIIDELPAGRKRIETYWVKHDMLERILAFIEKELRKGRQAYVVCPLIEESDKLDVQNALDVHSMLTHALNGRWKVGLMHGKLPADEKEQVMRSFSENECHILVSTTVIEVGVNVPNATIMLIYDADRFGLSQLHQLRGRVGRGDNQSFCILMADPKSETGKERMRIMTETTDGFKLSEKDLELRGPGDFFGRKQSGLPEFKVADMVHDYRALETARSDAAELISSSAFWTDNEYAALRLYLEKSGALKGEKLS
jgi:ATP-dependent DNA helicase RecG